MFQFHELFGHDCVQFVVINVCLLYVSFLSCYLRKTRSSVLISACDCFVTAVQYLSMSELMPAPLCICSCDRTLRSEMYVTDVSLL